MCMLSILYSNWLRQGHGAGCVASLPFQSLSLKSLGLSKGPSCKWGCTSCPLPWTSGLAAAVWIAWGEGTTWQRSIQVLEGLWLGKMEQKGVILCVCHPSCSHGPASVPVCSYTHSVVLWAVWELGWRVGDGWCCQQQSAIRRRCSCTLPSEEN